MELNVTNLPEEEFQEMNNLTEELLLVENEPETPIPTKTIEELSQEEEKLKIHLEKLKKENFSLQASINAWQATLKNKLDEFKEANLKLDEIYKKIWSEREKFCSKTDKFNEELGVLSEWWETQIKFVNDLECLEKKKSQDLKCRQEIKKLEKEIEDIKKEIEIIQAGKQFALVEVHLTAEGDSACTRGENRVKEVSPERLDKKKVRVSEAEDQINVCEDGTESIQNDLYSIVDLEKVKKANRNKNRRRAFLGKMKKCLT